MTETHTISTTVHGRYLVEAAGVGAPLLVGFHGYGQSAEQLLEDLRCVPGAAGWTLVAIQALHRFYSPKTRDVVGSWMTSQDRDLAIQDNLAYIRRVLTELRIDQGGGPLVFAGFSQGAVMAWRAAAHCGPCAGLMVLGGDLPQDVAEAPDLTLPPVLLGRGNQDPLYTASQLENDLAALAARGRKAEVVAFEGGHAWAPGFLSAAGSFLAALRS